ncbi:MAG: YcxB family protein [Bacteroidales bacterium]|nr:YcxB family protein [Bacteroidales bacterium]
MKIEFTIEKIDFLTLQLYEASRSKRIKQTRTRLQVLTSLIYVLIGFLVLLHNDAILALVFFGIAVIWYLLIPKFIRKRMVRSYSKFIDTHLANRYGQQASFTFRDEYIESESFIGKSKFKIKEMTEVDEIKDYYFLRFSTGVAIIIPKRKIENLTELKDKLNQIVENLNIPYFNHMNWVWK